MIRVAVGYSLTRMRTGWSQWGKIPSLQECYPCARSDLLPMRCARRRGGTKHGSGAGNLGARAIGDKHRPRIAASWRQVVYPDRPVQQDPVVDIGPADARFVVVALKNDGIAGRYRGRHGKHLEQVPWRFGHLEKGKLRHRIQFARAGDQITKRIGVDSSGPCPGFIRTLRGRVLDLGFLKELKQAAIYSIA